jgi:4-alpha-glucanotransferase
MRNGVEFIDFLAACGQKYWQILPLSPTSLIFGNSPYMSFSAFAGNPLYISPQYLREQGLLDEDDLKAPSFSNYFVEFDRVISFKKGLLGKAWKNFQTSPGKTRFFDFCRRASSWLNDYALFMSLKQKYSQAPWYEWPSEIRCANKKSLLVASLELEESIHYFRFEQFLFYTQWQRLRDYAHAKGVTIIGDLPIYVGTDSVDVWANQHIFELDLKTRKPTLVAGVPPDYFSKTGQLWGNPLYRWNTRKGEVKKQLYNWWHRRFQSMLSQVDVVRIDHFRGFASYFCIPAHDETAENGKWKRGPGINFFREMEKRLGRMPVIAEDLGIITPAVEKLRDELGFPGMKILLFAFDGNSDNAYLPMNYEKNSIVYTGTHDNDTAVGWFLDPDVPEKSKQQMKRAANRSDVHIATAHSDLIYLAMSSTAVLSIFPMQDILGFGNDCRMNTPATTENNWQWRCGPENLNSDVSRRLRDLTAFYGRLPRDREEQKNTHMKKS